jgi:AmmeMemoRadiSam system protein A
MSRQPDGAGCGSQTSASQAYLAAHEYSPYERHQLLKIAHDAISSVLERREVVFDDPSPHLAEQRGVFTTLYLNGELRGCVGYVFPAMPLIQAVVETARSAAFCDTRFLPVTHEEAERLKVSLSVLSTLRPIRAEELEIGVHGLMVSMGGHRGLLLPQVPVEHHWDRETFLDQTCLKAGLPAHAWRHGAGLEAFAAEVFADEDLDHQRV